MTPLGFIKLEIPTAVAEPSTGEGWIHEIKYDGYRTLIIIDHGQVRAFTRNGNERTRAYMGHPGSAKTSRGRIDLERMSRGKPRR